MKRIFIDSDKCDGCKNCSVACMQAHREIPGTIYDLDLTDIANESRNFIVCDQLGRYRPLFCRHCAAAECVTACMSGAMAKDSASGLVTYDRYQCAGCFMCVMSCPFGILKPDALTRTKVIKCDFCANDEHDPNCVKSCPKKAIYVEEVAL